MNKEKLIQALKETAELLEIKGVNYKPKAYQKAALALEKRETDLPNDVKEIKKIPGIGQSIAQKIVEFLKTGKIKYLEDLKKETAIQQIVTYYFETKQVNLAELKINARKKKIVYSRFTKPAKQLLELAGSTEKAKQAINKVAQWARTRNLDYSIETVFKKWLELDKLKPKEIVKKPYYLGNLMVWSEAKKKWFVIDNGGEWLEFAGKKQDIEWRIVK
jgi:DNA polymerase/3'-5' exonuclease PolX